MAERIVIYGTAGFAREVHELVEDLAAAGRDIACDGFLVDAAFRDADIVHGLPVLGDAGWLADAPDTAVAIAIGATAPRRRIALRIEAAVGDRWTVLRHPRAWTGRRVTVGTGTVVCAGAIATSDIAAGRHVQLHVGCTVGHDTVLGDFVTIAPGANVSGRVTIGEGAFIGAGAVVLPDRRVGPWSVVGAGAVVTRDVPANATVVGSPARILKERPAGWHLAG